MQRRMEFVCRVLTIALVLSSAAAPRGFGQNCQVTTPVRLLGEHDSPVSNVTVDQLKAEIGGSPARVIAVSPSDQPVVIFID